VSDGIHRIPVPTPFAVGRVNVYLIEDDPLTLVDAGPNSGTSFDELTTGLAAVGHSLEDIELVILTHQHIDHLGLVEIIVQHSGAEVAAIDVAVPFMENFGGDAERDDEEAAALMRRHGISEEVVTALRQVTGSFRAWGSKVQVSRPLRDGELLELQDRRLEVQHRPGHSPSDTVFWDEERRILLAADHLIGHISSNPLVTRPLDGSSGRPQALVTYLESMRRTRELPAEIVLSGHGDPITDHVALIDERIEKHERRKEKIHGVIAKRPSTGYEIAQELWGNVAVTQAFLTLSEVIGHVDLLVNAGYVSEVEYGNVLRYEATSDVPDDRLGDLIPAVPGNPVSGRG
jgi:glyoxylase-like metal-dependent hydrolase (beta-lactamase superfamily II)